MFSVFRDYRSGRTVVVFRMRQSVTRNVHGFGSLRWECLYHYNFRVTTSLPWISPRIRCISAYSRNLRLSILSTYSKCNCDTERSALSTLLNVEFTGVERLVSRASVSGQITITETWRLCVSFGNGGDDGDRSHFPPPPPTFCKSA
jgi:hypothetical protein